MSIPEYLHRKYGFADDAQVPTSFLEEELHLKPKEIRSLVKQTLNKGNHPSMIPFAVFVGVCRKYLNQ